MDVYGQAKVFLVNIRHCVLIRQVLAVQPTFLKFIGVLGDVDVVEIVTIFEGV